jgi:hypothetical protein
MRFDPNYQNQYMAYPINREQDGYAMNGYAPPPPGMFLSSLLTLSSLYGFLFLAAMFRPLSTNEFHSVRPQPRKRSRIPASSRRFESQSRSRRLCLRTTSWCSSEARRRCAGVSCSSCRKLGPRATLNGNKGSERVFYYCCKA